MKPLRSIPLVAALLLLVSACDATTYHDGRDASVITHTVSFSTASASINGNVASVQYEVPDISQGVVDYGAVLAFYREQGTWTAMPYTYGVESTEVPAVDYTVTLGYAYERRLMEIFYEASTDAVDLRKLPGRTVRFVIIRDLAYGKNGPDLRSYEQLQSYYGLPD